MRKKEKEEVIVKRYGRGILIGYAALCLAAAVLGAVMLWMSEWSFDSWYYVCCVAVGAGGFLWTVARIVRHSRTPKNLVVLRGSVLCAFTDAGRQEFRPEEIQFFDEDPIRKRSRTYDKGELDISLKDGRHIEIKYADGLTMAKERLLELKTLAQAGLETNALSGEEMTEEAKG